MVAPGTRDGLNRDGGASAGRQPIDSVGAQFSEGLIKLEQQMCFLLHEVRRLPDQISDRLQHDISQGPSPSCTMCFPSTCKPKFESSQCIRVRGDAQDKPPKACDNLSDIRVTQKSIAIFLEPKHLGIPPEPTGQCGIQPSHSSSITCDPASSLGTQDEQRFALDAAPSVAPSLFSHRISQARTIVASRLVTRAVSKEEKSRLSKERDVHSRGSFGPISRNDATCLQRVFEHPAFDAVCAGLVLVNAVLIGIATEHEVDSSTEVVWMVVFDQVLGFFFLFELCVRIGYWGTKFFTIDALWNMFDTCLVILFLIDFCLRLTTGTTLAIKKTSGPFRTLRVLRILRVFRIFHLVEDLRVMVLMVSCCLRPLFWALILLGLILFIYSNVLTSMCTELVANRLESSHVPWVQKNFGTLARTIYSLVISVLGGISWGELSSVLIEVSPSASMVFISYVIFTILAVLNIITGIFVENAVDTAKSQREFIVRRDESMKEAIVSEMFELFRAMDTDESGGISLPEMQELLANEHIRAYFEALGMSSLDAQKFFNLMDIDGTGEVDFGEFVEGVLKLKGEAKAIDVQYCLISLRQNKRMLKTLCARDSKSDIVVEIPVDSLAAALDNVLMSKPGTFLPEAVHGKVAQGTFWPSTPHASATTPRTP